MSMIVGIGASAGGHEAIQELFSELPTGCGLAVLVVFHLDPASGDLLPDLLSTESPYSVVTATNGVVVEPDHVYVAPPRTLLGLEGGRVRLRPTEGPEEARTPVDFLFSSLAQDQGDAAIAVVLSGNGSDGALGLRAIGEAGGLTLVQEPSTARHDGMPQSALATGVADHVAPPRALAIELVAFSRHYHEEIQGGRELRSELADALPLICEVLLQATGHNFRHYKASTLVRRTLRRLQVLRLSSATEYLEHLRTERSEVEALFRDLLISVTSFFRDPEAFESLVTKVIRPLIEARVPDEPIRVWVPGCATGEEAYTLAMIFREAMDGLNDPPKVQIFATDIDEHALSQARLGRYPAGIAEELSPERLERFFRKRNRAYVVSKEIRELVLFSAHNLINDPPFSRLDLISCRNLLIYLGQHLQKKLIPLFHFALKPTGHLFLGPAENLSAHQELFRPVDARYRISQRLPTSIRGVSILTEREGPVMPVRLPNAPVPSESHTYLYMQRIVLDEFAPKSVVINEQGQIVCASGNLEKYLTVSAGVFNNNVVQLCREGLRIGLRAALSDAVHVRRKIVQEGLMVRTDAGDQKVMITVQPMPQMGEETGLFLVVFTDVGLPKTRDEAPETGISETAASLIDQLERDLSATREALERTIQELEGTNEELKSSNEELLSMNEELQSANEELETSKEEIQQGNGALSRANNDLENLLSSTGIGTMFLDGSGCVRRVTPAIEAVYNVRAADVGRSLADFTHRLVDMPPLPDEAEVHASNGPIEHEMESVDGLWYLRRVQPYQHTDGTKEGMVVVFTDITRLKRAEDELRRADRRKNEFLAMLSHELRNPLAPIRNAAQVLKLKGSLDPILTEARDIIERQVVHMARLIDDLLDVSRITRGMLLLRRAPCDVVPLLQNVAEDHRALFERKGLVLECELPPGPIWVHGDQTRLVQIVGNLLHNSHKFTESGGRVTLRARQTVGGEVEVEVADEGIGIEPELAARVFEMFVQAEQGLDRARGGLGLGLFLVRGLAELHEGRAKAVSAGPGKGTAITITLPCCAPPPGAAPAAARA